MGIVVIGVLAVLSVPIMLIVALVKLSWIEGQLSSLDKKIETADIAKKIKAVPKPAAPVKDNAEEPEMKNRIESQKGDFVEMKVAKPPEPVKPVEPLNHPTTQPPNHPTAPYEPTAFDMFWMRIEDWLAVRGDFAPKGMTHEFAFATRWLIRIGVALIVGALIYFVKLSIDRGWMGPTGRVAATLFWGMVGCVGGSWLVKKEKYSLLGHAIAALGVVALYLGFGLGHRFFDPPVIASPVFAFAALAGVTLFAGVMAVYLRSPHIAVMGLVGGYLVPVIAGRDSGFPLWLDAYLLVLNLGAFYVARKRLWSALDFLASMLAVLMCFVWSASHPNSGGQSAVLVNLAFLSAVHALYMTGVIVGSKTRGKVGNAVAWSGLCINAVAYFAWLAAVFRESFFRARVSRDFAGLAVRKGVVGRLVGGNRRRGVRGRDSLGAENPRHPFVDYLDRRLFCDPLPLRAACLLPAFGLPADPAFGRRVFLRVCAAAGSSLVAPCRSRVHRVPQARRPDRNRRARSDVHILHRRGTHLRLCLLPIAQDGHRFRRVASRRVRGALGRNRPPQPRDAHHGALASRRLGRESAPYGHCTSRDPRSRRLVRARRSPPYRRSIPLHEVQGKV